VISGAANEAPNVEALVYIAAFGLDEGKNIDALSKQDRRPLALPQSHRRTIRASFGLIEIVSPRHLLRMCGFCTAAMTRASTESIEHQLLYSKVWIARMETSSILVHGCHRRPDNSSASRRIYGQENGCNYSQRTFKPRSDAFTRERSCCSDCVRSGVNREVSKTHPRFRLRRNRSANARTYNSSFY
jgi:hypothetical protein